MSLDAQDWVWEHSASKGTARIVLLAVADKASGPDCSAYAGTTFLVQRSNAARSSVVVAVDRLLDAGELKIVEGRTGPRGETCYSLPLAVGHSRRGGPESGPVRKSDPSGNRTPGGPESTPPRSGNETPSGPESGPQNTRNAEPPVETHNYMQDFSASAAFAEGDDLFDSLAAKSEEIHKQRGGADLSGFLAFWTEYPKKRDREEAVKEYRAAIARGADPDRITAGAKAYAIERRTEPAKFTKLAATWLRKGGYDDEPDPEPVAGPAQGSGGHEPYSNPADQSRYHEDY